MVRKEIVLVDKCLIVNGDAIIHNGIEMTVSNNNIKFDKFMGRTIFGDSYNLGYKKVMKIVFVNLLNAQ